MIEHERRAVLDQPDGSDLPGEEAALRELLKGQSVYDMNGMPTTVAPFHSERVSMPRSVEGCPKVEDVVAQEALSFWKATMS